MNQRLSPWLGTPHSRDNRWIHGSRKEYMHDWTANSPWPGQNSYVDSGCILHRQRGVSRDSLIGFAAFDCTTFFIGTCVPGPLDSFVGPARFCREWQIVRTSKPAVDLVVPLMEQSGKHTRWLSADISSVFNKHICWPKSTTAY